MQVLRIISLESRTVEII